MKVWVLAVGRPDRNLAGPIKEYERRAGRYWNLTVAAIRQTRRSAGTGAAEVREAESERLWERLPEGVEAVALTRTGTAWDSLEFADYLEGLAVRSRPGAAFLIGGAYGLSDRVLRRAHRRLSLSSLTLPHAVARLVLAEQLYRAGTIRKGEPYHKTRE